MFFTRQSSLISSLRTLSRLHSVPDKSKWVTVFGCPRKRSKCCDDRKRRWMEMAIMSGRISYFNQTCQKQLEISDIKFNLNIKIENFELLTSIIISTNFSSSPTDMSSRNEFSAKFSVLSVVAINLFSVRAWATALTPLLLNSVRDKCKPCRPFVALQIGPLKWFAPTTTFTWAFSVV